MNSDERRESKRTEVRMLAFVGTKDEKFVLVELLDVSPGGMRVRIGDIPLKKGDVLDLELEIDGESIEAKGEIVNFDAEDAVAGIMFVDISEDDVVTLETFSSSENW